MILRFEGTDRQIEFAYNLYDRVEELFNLYGLLLDKLGLNSEKKKLLPELKIITISAIEIIDEIRDFTEYEIKCFRHDIKSNQKQDLIDLKDKISNRLNSFNNVIKWKLT